ncbi:MAG: hypothetical protein NC116_09515 [Clostridium sp.]|nr:hypothetical protein [Clostridium sp.]
MENSNSDTSLILSMSLQDIDNLIKDLKLTHRMYRFASLLRHAAETDSTLTKRNIGYSVQTGQVGASHSELGKEWNCNRSTATRFLKELEADGLVKVTGNVSFVTDIKCLLGWQYGDKVIPNLSSDNELVYQLIN